MVYNIILMIIGFILLVKGADFLIKGATGIAKRFHISEMLIGIIVVGIGTSLPEIIITITSSLNGNAGIIVGNAIGSTICNLLLVIGIASICRPLKIDQRLLKVHLPLCLIAVIIFYIVANFGIGESLQITKIESVILLIITISYMVYSAFEGRKENEDNKKKLEEDKEIEEHMGMFKILFYMILGILGLKYGSDFVVDTATYIAQLFDVSQSVISLTIVAVGTALPEIVTSIIAAMKQESDIAMGNVIGSNIYNLLLLPAIGGIIKPIEYDPNFNISLVFASYIIIYLFMSSILRGQSTKKSLSQNSNVISRRKGIIFVSIYLVYTARLFFGINF